MEERKKEKKVRENRQKVEDMVPKQFHRWLKVFGKQDLERMPVQKPWYRSPGRLYSKEEKNLPIV